jgi:fatty acid desaturase
VSAIAGRAPNDRVTRETAQEPQGPKRRQASGLDAEAVKMLKGRDNLTNWYYLAQVYAVIAATIATTLWGSAEIAAHGFGWGWSVLLNTIAIVVIGASQHQLGGVVHEGTHFLLFKNRKLNEVASDWLAAFPIFTSTYQFRVHHLAHHQFVNDHERDPDIAQLKDSGHWLDFPLPHIDLALAFLKTLSPLGLARYTLIRARYSAAGFEKHAYIDPAQAGTRWPLRIALLFAIPMPFVLYALAHRGTAAATIAVLLVSWLVATGALLLVPKRLFAATRLEPVISHRATLIGRISYLAALYGVITALELGGYGPVWGYFGLYWMLPLFTAFPLFMMLRQWVQHGNADRGRYTNTRVFLVGPLIRYAVFPWGMDYHLPHHLMASVPHYHLRRLHELLLADPEYRAKGTILEGFFSGHGLPSALAALGPDHAPRIPERNYVDNATLEYADVRDAAAIAREAMISQSASSVSR